MLCGIFNWQEYNTTLVCRGALTLWTQDETTRAGLYEEPETGDSSYCLSVRDLSYESFCGGTGLQRGSHD